MAVSKLESNFLATEEDFGKIIASSRAILEKDKQEIQSNNEQNAVSVFIFIFLLIRFIFLSYSLLLSLSCSNLLCIFKYFCLLSYLSLYASNCYYQIQLSTQTL